MTPPPTLHLLPMFGKTHGSRSAVTCHLKCASACDAPVPNDSTEATFADIASKQLSRRNLLVGAGALTAAAAIPVAWAEPAAAAPATGAAAAATRGRTGGLPFTPIASVDASVDALTVPKGYQWTPILRWGDPLFANSPALRSDHPGRRGPGTAVRLQQRLPRHHRHRPPRS